MFTGLIEDVGRIAAWRRHGKGARLAIATSMDVSAGVAVGDSVGVNGMCLTALALGAGRFEADVSQETIDRTSLVNARVGDPVNLERALRLGDRLGGHMVQGHVDAVGVLVARVAVGESWDVTFELPDVVLDTVVEKGSIALDGVSLTVAGLSGDRVRIAVVPHTADKTTLLKRPIGSLVNVETDVIGKYVLRALTRMSPGSESAETAMTRARREELGYV